MPNVGSDDELDEAGAVRPTAPSSLRLVSGPTAAPDGQTWLWRLLSHAPAARERWSELLRLATTSVDRQRRAETLNAIGRFASAAGDPSTAHLFFQEALVAGRSSQDAASVACSLSGLAQVAAGRGAVDLARTLEEEALAIRRRLGDPAATARSLAVLAWLSLESRGTAQAEALHEESLTLRVSLKDPLALAYSLVHLGWLAHLLGRRESARRHLAEALDAVRRHPARWKVVALLALLGRPAAAETPTRQAILLLIAAEAVEALGESEGADAGELPLSAAGTRRHLDARELAVAWSGGGDVDADALVEQALRSSPPMQAADHTPNGGAGVSPTLTRRELEVATLISRGHTNRRIADVLVIAERTAETHARNIREKLGLTSRAQIAAWAVMHGHLDTTRG